MNTYLFIIWNKALFAKDKIIKDIEENFRILYQSTIYWDEKHYHLNLKGLYGHKIPDVDDKISCIGKGPFELIVFEDENPVFGERGNANDTLWCNTRVFDKKALYRNWTGGAFRIHGSSNEEEFNHDMAVLIGPEYRQILKEKEIHRNIKSIEGFKGDGDFFKTMEMFGNNRVFRKEYAIVAKYSTDVRMFLYNTSYKAYGIMEGEIPEMDEALYPEFINIITYHKDKLDSFLKEHDLLMPETRSVMSPLPDTSFMKRLKREFKLNLLKIKNH